MNQQKLPDVPEGHQLGKFLGPRAWTSFRSSSCRAGGPEPVGRGRSLGENQKNRTASTSIQCEAGREGLCGRFGGRSNTSYAKVSNSTRIMSAQSVGWISTFGQVPPRGSDPQGGVLAAVFYGLRIQAGRFRLPDHEPRFSRFSLLYEMGAPVSQWSCSAANRAMACPAACPLHGRPRRG